MATTLYHTTTGAPVNVHMQGGGMQYKPQPRICYAKRLLLAQAERAAQDAEAAKEFEKDPRRCMAEKNGEQCKGYRVKGGLYCVGHTKSDKRRNFHHEDFEEALPLKAPRDGASAAKGTAHRGPAPSPTQEG